LPVVGLAYQAAGQPADQFLTTGDEAEMRTSKAGRQPQLLALTDRDISLVLAGRGQNRKADGIDAGNRERTGGVGSLRQRCHVLDQAQEVRLLRDQRRRIWAGV